MLHVENFLKSEKHCIYKSKYVVNDHTLKKLRSKTLLCPSASKVKVLIVNESFNIKTFV